MHSNPPFDPTDIEKARNARLPLAVRNLIFFDATYQIEVSGGGEEASHWTFIQLNDHGKVSDYFCGCESYESTGSCPHLVKSYDQIYAGSGYPIHLRFKKSIFYRLFKQIAKKVNFQSRTFEHAEDQTLKLSLGSGEKIFSLKPTNKEGHEKLDEIVLSRVEPSEETSLFLSNLSEDEVLRWKKGMASAHIHYELSVWADIAKWCMWLFDEGKLIGVSFDRLDQLPKKITLTFSDFTLDFSLAKEDWPKLIPTLKEINAPIPVFEFSDFEILSIQYDADKGSFLLEKEKIDQSKGTDGEQVAWDDWVYRAGQGFFKKQTDGLMEKDQIPHEEVGDFLSQHVQLLERFLKGSEIEIDPMSAKYTLSIDEEDAMHIECYVFEEGDLKRVRSQLFDPWVYVEPKGFFKLKDLLFSGVEKVIPKEKMSEFIDRHRGFLNQYEQFYIHLSSIDTQITYSVTDEGIQFHSESALSEKDHDFIDYGKWVYVKGQGFYSKGAGPSRALRGSQFVSLDNASRFIKRNFEDLEQVKGFFYHEEHVKSLGLIIEEYQAQSIRITPEYELYKEYPPDQVIYFGDYVYIKGEGFSEVPDDKKVPEKYQRETVIPSAEMDYFIKQELPRIKPFILSMDHRLLEPKRMKLTLNLIHEEEQKGAWRLDMRYKTEYGEVSIYELWRHMHNFQTYALSDAGLIDLKSERFFWIHKLVDDQFSFPENYLKYTTLEWVRLSSMESIDISPRLSEKEKAYVEGLTGVYNPNNQEMPRIDHFKSKLRAYQEIGVKWLWYLYFHGLSGLLCDEMGLGKTHQTMALLGAVKTANPHAYIRSLVVCPTSVLYHWQSQLERYLPKMQVFTYYGSFRNPKALKKKCDIILTSYGVLRSDQEIFADYSFEILVMDEMQMAKNARSQINRVLRGVKAQMKLGLTGTPMENNLGELKAIFDIVLPNYFLSESEYKEQYVLPIEKHNDPQKRKELSMLIKPFILRRRKSDVLTDLPEKIEEVYFVELTKEQKKLYRETFLRDKDALLEEVEENCSTFNLHVFALLSRLKQICNHPALITGNIERAHEHHQSGKWALFVELLDETLASGQKLVVFSQYLDMLTIIENYLKSRSIGFAAIRGSTRDRKEEIDRFNKDEECKVFVGSLQAAGFGIDLTAGSVLIHYDRWWNYAKETQATDRIHRIGQKRCVNVYKIVCKDTLEEHINSIIEKKKGLIQNVIGYDSPEEMMKLDRSELVALLNKIHQDIEEPSGKE